MKRGAFSFCSIIYLTKERLFAEIALCILPWHVNYQGETSSPAVLHHGRAHGSSCDLQADGGDTGGLKWHSRVS